MRSDVVINRHYRASLNNDKIEDKNAALKTCLNEITRIDDLELGLRVVNNVVSAIIGDGSLKFDQTGLSDSFIKSVKFLTANSRVRYGKDVTRGGAILLFACCLRYSQLSGAENSIYKEDMGRRYEFVKSTLDKVVTKNFGNIPSVDLPVVIGITPQQNSLSVSSTSHAEGSKQFATVLRDADIKAVMNFDRSYLDGCHVEDDRLVVYKKNGCLSHCLFGDDFHGYNTYDMDRSYNYSIDSTDGTHGYRYGYCNPISIANELNNEQKVESQQSSEVKVEKDAFNCNTIQQTSSLPRLTYGRY